MKTTFSQLITHDSRGISLISLIVTIIVIIILTSITFYNLNSPLESVNEAKFKSDFRTLMDRLKVYHEKANLEAFKYRNVKLTWDGLSYYAENTGKVEDPEREDSVEYILGNIPAYFKNKIAISKGKIIVDTEKFSETELAWIESLGISTENNEEYVYENLELSQAHPENVINTGLNLFGAEYREKDFEVRIKISRIDDNVNEATILNIKKEESNFDTNYGVVIRKSSGGKYSLKLTGSATAVQKDVTAAELISNEIVFRREEGTVYYSIGNIGETQFTDTIPEFEVPLTIGCSLDQNGEEMRYANCHIDYANITIYGKKKVIEEDENAPIQMFERYNLVLDGNNLYDTGICLYSSDNIERDFEIKFKIKTLNRTIKDGTIINSMKEVSPWPGFAFRFNGNNNNQLDIRSVRTSLNPFINKDSVVGTEMMIYRKNKALYYKIGDEDPVNIRYSPVIHDIPVTLGGGYAEDGTTPQRKTPVTFEYIKITVKK